MRDIRWSAALLCCGLAAAVSSPASAADRTPEASVNINTMRMKITLPPGLPAGIPALEQLKQAHRMLNVVVSSPGSAPQDATATMGVPAGLGVGDRVDLGITRPQPPNNDHSANPFVGATMNIYWGCGDTVGDGQPRVLSMDALDERIGRMIPRMDRIFKETMAMWPSGAVNARGGRTGGRGGNGGAGGFGGFGGLGGAPGALKPDASAAGDYALKTSYAGSADFSVGENQDFLAPIEVTGIPDQPDLNQAIPITWNAVPHALGYRITAVGSRQGADGKMISVIWMSSRRSPFGGTAPNADDTFEQGLLLPPDTTSCTLPAGVMKGTTFSILTVEAVGPTKRVAGPLPVRISTTSTMTVPLGISAFGGFGGAGGRPGGQ